MLARTLVAVAFGSTAVPAWAQEATQGVWLHGFGERAYGKTYGNDYLAGTNEGNYRDGLLAVAIGANPRERLQISTQIAVEEDTGGAHVELEYAFAEWRFSDAFRLRAGRIKQPFGIYAEIFHVGTVRPFYTLPAGIYRDAGIVAEGFDGVGITGRKRLAGEWAVEYDVYGGGILVANSALVPDAQSGGEPVAEGEEIETIRDTLGGRVKVETPVSGLVFGASAYTGKEGVLVRHTAFGVQGEYLTGPWSVRAEYVRHTETQGPQIDASYLEGARRLGAHWQAAVRYDWSDTKDPRVVFPAADLGRHRDAAFGLNYWFHSSAALKFSYHHVEGNRFARPEAGQLADQIASGRLNKRTDLVLIGVQFSF